MGYKEELEKKIEQLTEELDKSQTLNDKCIRFIDRLNEFIQDRLPVYENRINLSLRRDDSAREGYEILKIIKGEMHDLL